MGYKSIRTSALLMLSIITLIAYANPAVAITWSDNVHQVTDYPFFDGSPSITQTSDGKVWIVWSRDINGYYILYYKTYSDSGAPLSEPTNLTAKQGVGDNVGSSIIESANGTIWVVWASNRKYIYEPPDANFYMNATPASLTIQQGGTDNSTITATSVKNFSDTLNLHASSVPGVTSILDPPQIFVPPNENATSLLTVSVDPTATPGNYTLTVIGQPHNHRFVRSVRIALEITESGAATPSYTLSSPSSASSSATESVEDYEIFCKTSNDYGATWSNDTQLTDNTFDDLSPSIAQLANGTIMVVWESTENGNPDIVYKTTSDGASWSDEKPITTSYKLDSTPSVIQAKDEKIWVTWASNTTYGDFDIHYKTYDGLSWSNATNLTNSPNSDTSPSILQTIDEKIWIFWTSSEIKPTATGDIYYMVSSDNGATWSDSIQFTTDINEDSWSAVTQTSYTKIWVVWTSNRADQPDGNWEIYYRTSLVGDLNGDGVVDIPDVSIVAQAYGFVVGEIEYSPDADINKDNIVDVKDLALVGRNYGST